MCAYVYVCMCVPSRVDSSNLELRREKLGVNSEALGRRPTFKLCPSSLSITCVHAFLKSTLSTTHSQ